MEDFKSEHSAKVKLGREIEKIRSENKNQVGELRKIEHRRKENLKLRKKTS